MTPIQTYIFNPLEPDPLNSYLEWALQPILEALLSSGANAARVALVPSSPQPQDQTPLRYALGPAKDLYVHLDEAILAWVQKGGTLALDDQTQVQSLGIPETLPSPAALMAVALLHENRTLGVLWTAFDGPRQFSAEDERFFLTLAGQAALAAANAHLFRAAEVGSQRLAAILTSTSDPLLVTDRENRLILANPAAKSILVAMAGAAMGQTDDQVINQQELFDLLQKLESGKRSAELALPDGRVYYATASAVITAGRPVGRICVLRDVTPFKELDALKSDFVSTVSHDLRAPLTLIRGYATMLETAGDLNDQQKNYIGKMLIGVESMTHLVNNLLDLGRIEAGVGLQVDEVPVMEIVEAVLELLQLQANQKKIQLAVEEIGDLPAHIQADRTLVQQALFNLLENAIKYTPENGTITLRLMARPEGLQYEVQDSGIGIAPADLPRLFEKFYRGSQREARLQHGTGLGLAIVRSIAGRHGGRVWVESELGQGSTFFLLLPFTQPEGAHTQAANSG